jgi:hypothetical protein
MWNEDDEYEAEQELPLLTSFVSLWGGPLGGDESRADV